MSTFILGISGGSCSGKTTFAAKLCRRLGPSKATLLFQDNYYIDQSARFKEDGGDVNFDHPSALDFTLLAEHLRMLKQGQRVQVPIYDFHKHTRKVETLNFEPSPLVVLDGTLILSVPEIRALLDNSVFLEADEDTRLSRRIRRDTHERGRTENGVRLQFNNHVKPMHDQFVSPSKAFASILIDSSESFERALSSISAQYLT